MLFNESFTVEDYVEERLQQWAKWCKAKISDQKLDYPSQTIIYRMMKEGYFIPKKRHKNGIKPMEPNIAAEEVEILINRMAKESLTYQKSAMVIRAHYLHAGKKGGKPKAVGVKATTFRELLIIGRSWLTARLSMKIDLLYK